MANRNPWLVWRVKALNAGYIPPLLPGHIPPEMARLAYPQEQPYEPETLVRHAHFFRSQQSRWIRKGFTLFVVGFLLTVMIAFLYLWKFGADYRFSLIDALSPKIESTVVSPWM